jgi:hypothetical protein
LKGYIPGANPTSAKSNFTVWIQLHLAINEDPLLKITKHRDSEMNWHYDQNGGGMYMPPLGNLDCPMYILGWMTYAGNFTDPKAMNQMLLKTLLATSVGFNILIGIKLKHQKGIKMTDEMKLSHPWSKKTCLVHLRCH